MGDSDDGTPRQRVVLLLVVVAAICTAGSWAIDRLCLHPNDEHSIWRLKDGGRLNHTFLFFWVSFFIWLLVGLWVLVTVDFSNFRHSAREAKWLHWVGMAGSASLIFLSATIIYWILSQPMGNVSLIGPISLGTRTVMLFVLGMIIFAADRRMLVEGRVRALLPVGIGVVTVGAIILGVHASMKRTDGPVPVSGTPVPLA
jgi:uncharacterized protein with PQ loop repeat